jgi:hypothetical protein
VALEPAGSLSAVKELTVDGGLTAKSVGDGTVTVKVTVSKDATLAVATPIKFDQTASTIAGTFWGSAAEGANVPAVAGGVVNGTTIKEGEKIVIVSGNTLPSFAAGTIYQISGSITLTANVTVPADVTLVIRPGASLTGSYTIDGEGTVIVEGTGTAPGMPKFSADIVSPNTGTQGDGKVNPPGLTIVSATKDLKSKNITVKLGGEITGGIASGSYGYVAVWDAGGTGKLTAGKYSWTVLENVIPPKDGTLASMEIKHTNPGFTYYSGTSSVVTNTLITAALPNGGRDVYVPAGSTDGTGAFKWRQYSGLNSSPAAGTPWETGTSDKGFGILLYSGASVKQAKLEIKYPITGEATSYTAIVDWSGVTIK